jgi:hypothetical protein
MAANAVSSSISGVAGNAFSYRGGAYPGTGGTCLSSISATSCTVELVFLAPTSGSFQSTLAIAYNNGLQNTSTNITLLANAGSAATLQLSDSPSFTFASAGVGAVVQKLFFMNHAGDVPAETITPTNMPNGFRYTGGIFPGTRNCAL